MPDRNMLEKGSESTCKCRNCVALYQNQIGALCQQNRAKAEQDCRCEAVQVLIVSHHRKIVIGTNAKEVQHLVEQFAMLTGDADPDIEIGRAPRCLDDRRHFDSFGPRAKNEEDLHGRLST